MKRETLAESIRLECARLCHSSLDSRTLRIELLKRLRKILPFDYAYFSTTDPVTQFGTSVVLADDPPSWLMPLFVENEFLQDDFNKFSDMLRHRQPVAVLSEATGYDLNRSQRYRDMLVPLDMGDELRSVFVTEGACWGTLCLHRGQAESGYTAGEAAFLTQLVPHIAEGLRKALLIDDASLASTPDGPSALILAEDLSPLAMTPAAEHWLSELAGMGPWDRLTLPLPVRSVAAGLQAVEHGLAAANLTPKLHLRTRSGHWLVLHASRLRSSAGQQICVIFERAQPAEIMPLVIQVYELTKREGEITRCVLQGWSTAEIAVGLHISPNTVQDHLKAIFAKVDVSSRRELTARIFAQQFQPSFQSSPFHE